MDGGWESYRRFWRSRLPMVQNHPRGLTIIVIMFGEIIPKIYGNQEQERLIYRIVNILDLMIKQTVLSLNFLLLPNNLNFFGRNYEQFYLQSHILLGLCILIEVLNYLDQNS